MQELSTCPVCSGLNFSPFLTCKDHTVSGKEFQIVSCDHCGFKFTNPRPEESELGAYYKSEEYISHSNTSKGIVNKLYQTVRRYTLLQKLKLVFKLSKKPGRILDIGCGTGEFLKTCKDAKWDAVGIEPDSDARAFAQSNHKISVFEEAKLEELEPSSFDIISMWHVLEHVPDLNKRVEQIKRLLKKNGSVIIAVPNCSSLDASIYKENWAAYDVPRHLYHFTPKDIESLFDKHGFIVSRTLPMVFDSFYVSMLSEKYKNQKISYLSSVWNGFRSNLAANRTGKTFSSQIYIIKAKP